MFSGHVVVLQVECPRASPPVHVLKACPQRGGFREVTRLADVLPLGPHGESSLCHGSHTEKLASVAGKGVLVGIRRAAAGVWASGPQDCETELSVIQPPVSWWFLTAPRQDGPLFPFRRED